MARTPHPPQRRQGSWNVKKILLRRKCLLLACFVTGLGFSKAVNAAPGDEQWDDRFGSITTPASGALTVYQDEIYLSTHKWDGTNLIFWSKPLAYYASGAGYSDMTAIGSNSVIPNDNRPGVL